MLTMIEKALLNERDGYLVECHVTRLFCKR
jgi:hypothetical protein